MVINKKYSMVSPMFLNEFTFISEGVRDIEISLNNILQESFSEWNSIKFHLANNFLLFEPLLNKIHYQREKKFSEQERYALLKFLTLAYCIRKDVRYFNEFLYFYRNGEKFRNLQAVVLNSFFLNLDEQNQHFFPLGKKKDVEKWVSSFEGGVNVCGRKTSILLIGIPTFFHKAYKELKAQGHEVKVFSIPHHSDAKVAFLLKNKLLWRIYEYLSGAPPYKNLNFSHTSSEITEEIKRTKAEIGFHKLGFIIKGNIFMSFPKGLLNDHWAVLPFVRGRSTIEYSILFGFPVAVSVHFVERKIDEGNIVRIFNYNIGSLKKISQIKNRIKSDLTRRIVDSLNSLSAGEFSPVQNDSLKGLTHYEIHRELLRWIEDQILARH